MACNPAAVSSTPVDVAFSVVKHILEGGTGTNHVACQRVLHTLGLPSRPTGVQLHMHTTIRLIKHLQRKGMLPPREVREAIYNIAIQGVFHTLAVPRWTAGAQLHRQTTHLLFCPHAMNREQAFPTPLQGLDVTLI